MPVAHQSLAAVVGHLVGMAAEHGRDLRLNGLRQPRSGAIAQNLGQGIGKSSWRESRKTLVSVTASSARRALLGRAMLAEMASPN